MWQLSGFSLFLQLFSDSGVTFGGRHLDQGVTVSGNRTGMVFVDTATFRAQLREAQMVAMTFTDRLTALQERYERLENAATAAWVNMPSEYQMAQYQLELDHLRSRIRMEQENVSWSHLKLQQVCQAFRNHVERIRAEDQNR